MKEYDPSQPREPDGKFGSKGGGGSSGSHQGSASEGRGYDAERRSEALGAKSASQLHKWLDGKTAGEALKGAASAHAVKALTRMVVKSIATHLVTQSVAMADALIANAVESALRQMGGHASRAMQKSSLASSIKNLFGARVEELGNSGQFKTAADRDAAKAAFDAMSRAWAEKNPEWRKKYGK